MTGAQWLLELVLVGLLAATLVHAIRLERALGVLKRDRAVLESLVAGFNDSTRQAESGVARLREAADGAGRHLARQIEQVRRVEGDLGFLIERGDGLADRLDALVRAARPLSAGAPVAGSVAAAAQPVVAPDTPPPRSQAERDLLQALRLAR
ncbi:MAG: hypothetical protein KGL52_15475 [Rhodospirillales bacterium]|jgi:hypothetical protein|nr:hypothetical protein [Rhodospirillales bacterium]